MTLYHKLVLTGLGLLLSVSLSAADKPNVLVIWGDDIGITNISELRDHLYWKRAA